MTARDMQVIEFLSGFVGRTSTLARFFFDSNLRVAQRRLQAMTTQKHIKRVKADEFIYYTKRPKHFTHALAVSDYLCYLSHSHKITEMRAEYRCGNVQADALVLMDNKPTFVEVQLTGYPDMLKYLTLRVSKIWQDYFQEFPAIRLLSDRQPKNCGLDVFVDCTLNVRSVFVCCTL